MNVHFRKKTGLCGDYGRGVVLPPPGVPVVPEGGVGEEVCGGTLGDALTGVPEGVVGVALGGVPEGIRGGVIVRPAPVVVVAVVVGLCIEPVVGGMVVVVGLCIEPIVEVVRPGATSQWKGSNSEFGSAQLGLREAKMINGAATTTITPIKSTANHTVLLPVAIWLGGIKLSTKASNEPKKPRPPTSHIKPLPFLPIRNGRPAFFIE